MQPQSQFSVSAQVGYQPPPAQPYQQAGVQYVAYSAQKTEGLCVASLVTGILAWVIPFVGLLLALLAAFLPRVLIGVFAYYAYRALRPWPPLAAGAAGLVGTLINSIGVLGLLLLLGTPDVAALIPVILTNVPFEIILAVVITTPVVAALRAAWRGQIAGDR